MQNGQSGILDAMRKVGAAIVRLYKARVEIASIELREEVERVERRLILLGVLGFLLTMVCLCATGVGIVLLGRAIGYAWAFGIFTFLYLAASIAVFLLLKHEQRERPDPFSQTRAEFEKDAEHFKELLETREPRTNQPEAQSEAAHRIAPLL